jgi:transcriptional regulator with XRE-family HTH domain
MFDPGRFGERIHTLRRRQDLTLRALGEMADVSYVTVSKIERGKMPQVSVDIVLRLANALGVSVDYLLGRKEEESV